MIILNLLTRKARRRLAGAFPSSLQRDALKAAAQVVWRLGPDQRGEPFVVRVATDEVAIPHRLYFDSPRCSLAPGSVPWLMSHALRSRSSDGFERQRAALDLLAEPTSWNAPFIVALIGE